MSALSLSPRFDLFHFEYPKDYFPKEILEKYGDKLSKDKSVIMDPVSYVNESIQGITFPGLSDLCETQNQISYRENSLGRLKVEPTHENVYISVDNPLKKIDGTFKVTMRQNQGLLNYFMMYETTFHRIVKSHLYNKSDDVFTVDILDETGSILSKIIIMQPVLDSIQGLEFNCSKKDREFETFDLEYKFNNIDFDFV